MKTKVEIKKIVAPREFTIADAVKRKGLYQTRYGRYGFIAVTARDHVFYITDNSRCERLLLERWNQNKLVTEYFGEITVTFSHVEA